MKIVMDDGIKHKHDNNHTEIENQDDDGDGNSNGDYIEEYWGDGNTTTATIDSATLTRPIVVGYAFGPKKMSTMGVVMAEASKTKLALGPQHSVDWIANHGNNNIDNDRDRHKDLGQSTNQQSEDTDDGDTDHRNQCRCLHQHQQRDSFAHQATHASPQRESWTTPTPLQSSSLMVSTSLSPSHSPQANPHESDGVGLEGGVGQDTNVIAATPTPTCQFQIHHEQLKLHEPHGGSSSSYDWRITDGGAGGQITFHNIVRCLRSSSASSTVCSSSMAEDTLSTGTCTVSSVISSTTGSQQTTRRRRSCGPTPPPQPPGGGGDHSRIMTTTRILPIRVSFVPLDMELPLEEQHGGQMDVILHKLTEDILCLSILARTFPQLRDLSTVDTIGEDRILRSVSSSLPSPATPSKDEQNEEATRDSSNHANTSLAALSETEWAAVRRVHRLCQFQRSNPHCYLVDDPIHVQALMSREQIARTLEKCLIHVHSMSGIPVQTPKYTVLPNKPSQQQQQQQQQQLLEQTTLQQHEDPDTAACSTREKIEEQIEKAGLSYPVIVKPLIAAGTKASHSMILLFDAASIPVPLSDCICQQYCNHDAVLYKVYVLGNYVSVHKRRSLPNLPTKGQLKGFFEFDSQRPYPRLSDFGIADPIFPIAANENQSYKTNTADIPTLSSPKTKQSSRQQQQQSHRNLITADEIKPIVDSLKEAFCLQLFGFDLILIPPRTPTSTKDESSSITTDATHDSNSTAGSGPKLMVVDVNYFPSYKEVPQFPNLLAKFLIDHAIASRLSLVADC